MKLDKFILILYFNDFNRDVFVFDNKDKYKKFIENHIKEFEERGLASFNIYYASLAMKG